MVVPEVVHDCWKLTQAPPAVKPLNHWIYGTVVGGMQMVCAGPLPLETKLCQKLFLCRDQGGTEPAAVQSLFVCGSTLFEICYHKRLF